MVGCPHLRSILPEMASVGGIGTSVNYPLGSDGGTKGTKLTYVIR